MLKLFLVILNIAFCTDISTSSLNHKTTYDEMFEDRFQVEHITEGDKKTYPEYYKFVRMKFKGFLPSTGQVFDSTDRRGGIYEFQYRKNKSHIITPIVHPFCWDETYPRMSTGEKIIIICESQQAFGNIGLYAGSKILVKPGETVAFELEMIDAQYDPFNFKLIRKGVNNIYPQHMDLISYKFTLWVGDDREFEIVKNYHMGDSDINGSPFDEAEKVCITEALRRLTIGGICEIQCPRRYAIGHLYYTKYHIADNTDLGFRIQLLSLKQENWHKHSDIK